MGGFLDYLDGYEKKLNEKIITQPKSIQNEKKVVHESSKIQSKKVVNVIKKSVVIKEEDHINRANNILDGIDDYGFSPMVPTSTRFYDNTGLSSKLTLNKDQSKDVSDRANDILSEDCGGEYFNNILPQPLMNIPPVDPEMLKFVPPEMLNEQQKQQIQTVKNIQPKQIDNQSQKEVEIPPEIKKMMEETKQMQQMFATMNADMQMPELPPEFRNY
ncbi:MAG: hypothetical protein QXG00_08780 [Candidatus Woesearchaeota archaeon]